jgi:hypothetical protein
VNGEHPKPREALSEDLDYVCRETACGKTDNPTRWIGGEKIAATGLCFNCNFWGEYLKRKDAKDVVRAQGRHYVVCSDPSPGSHPWKGFGGHRFKIRFHDGREVETTNLWSQGVIPQHFKERMPDNAVFLEGMGHHDD